MSILINKNTRVITQGITGKTGQFHTRWAVEYANGKACYVGGRESEAAPARYFEGIADLRRPSPKRKRRPARTSR